MDDRKLSTAQLGQIFKYRDLVIGTEAQREKLNRKLQALALKPHQ